jgi:hypothetical protein
MLLGNPNRVLESSYLVSILGAVGAAGAIPKPRLLCAESHAGSGPAVGATL